jgi:hypothetical protein
MSWGFTINRGFPVHFLYHKQKAERKDFLFLFTRKYQRIFHDYGRLEDHQDKKKQTNRTEQNV